MSRWPGEVVAGVERTSRSGRESRPILSAGLAVSHDGIEETAHLFVEILHVLFIDTLNSQSFVDEYDNGVFFSNLTLPGA